MPSSTLNTIAVLGSGHGGLAAAVDLTARGFDVHLHARRDDRVAQLRNANGIKGRGIQTGNYQIAKITNNIAEAVSGVDLIMLVVPSVAHEYYAQGLAPLLDGTKPVFLNPGHTGGGLHFTHELRRHGYKGPIKTCETVTLTYISRLESDADVSIYSYTTNLGFSAFPGKYKNDLFDQVKTLYPEIIKASSVLETGLSNINAIFHPPGMILNMGWIQRTDGDFYFYKEGITEGVGRATKAIDDERLLIAQALEIPAKPFLDIFFDAGLTTEAARLSGSISEACEQSEPNALLRSPNSLDHRYVHEDVGFGLVPFAALGQLGKVKTPTIDAFIQMANVATGNDYRRDGLTLERMGLHEMSIDRVHQFIENG
jgi:opine dehydrogenase